jgi:hypothetical protein
LTDHCDHLRLLWLQPVAVLEEKDSGRKEARSLVAVSERVIIDNALAVGGGQLKERWFLVTGKMLGPRKRAFQEALLRSLSVPPKHERVSAWSVSISLRESHFHSSGLSSSGVPS